MFHVERLSHVVRLAFLGSGGLCRFLLFADEVGVQPFAPHEVPSDKQQAQ